MAFGIVVEGAGLMKRGSCFVCHLVGLALSKPLSNTVDVNVKIRRFVQSSEQSKSHACLRSHS